MSPVYRPESFPDGPASGFAPRPRIRASAMATALLFLVALSIGTAATFNGLSAANEAVLNASGDYDLHFAAISTIHEIKSHALIESQGDIEPWLLPPDPPENPVGNHGFRDVRKLWNYNSDDGFRDPATTDEMGAINVEFWVDGSLSTGVQISALAVDPLDPERKAWVSVGWVANTPASNVTYWPEGFIEDPGLHTDGRVVSVGYVVENGAGSYSHADTVTVTVTEGGDGGEYWAHTGATTTFDQDDPGTPTIYDDDFDPSDVPSLPGYAPFENVRPIDQGVEPLVTGASFEALPPAEGAAWTDIVAGALDPPDAVVAFYTRGNLAPTHTTLDESGAQHNATNVQYWKRYSTRWVHSHWDPYEPPTEPPPDSAPTINTTSVPNAQALKFYNQSISVSGYVDGEVPSSPTLTVVSKDPELSWINDSQVTSQKRLKGTPPDTVVGGPYSITLEATNSLGTDTVTLLITVDPPEDPPGSHRDSDDGRQVDNAFGTGERTVTRVAGATEPDEFVLYYNTGWVDTGNTQLAETVDSPISGITHYRYEKEQDKWEQRRKNMRVELDFRADGTIYYRTSTWWSWNSTSKWGPWAYLRDQADGLVLYFLGNNGATKEFESDVDMMADAVAANNGENFTDRNQYGFRAIYIRGTYTHDCTVTSECDVYLSGSLEAADIEEDTFGIVSEDDVFVLFAVDADESGGHGGGGDTDDPGEHWHDWGMGYNATIEAAIYAIDDFTYAKRSGGTGMGNSLTMFGSFVWGDGQTQFGDIYQVRNYVYDDKLSFETPPSYITQPGQIGFVPGSWGFGFGDLPEE